MLRRRGLIFSGGGGPIIDRSVFDFDNSIAANTLKAGLVPVTADGDLVVRSLSNVGVYTVDFSVTPTYKTNIQNGLSALNFSPSAVGKTGPDTSLDAKPLTIFFVGTTNVTAFRVIVNFKFTTGGGANANRFLQVATTGGTFYLQGRTPAGVAVGAFTPYAAEGTHFIGCATFYMDVPGTIGVSVNDGAEVTNTGATAIGSGHLDTTIGADQSDGNRFNGYKDELVLFPWALSASERTQGFDELNAEWNIY